MLGKRMNDTMRYGMTRKLTLYSTVALAALLMGAASSVHAQTFNGRAATSLILAGNGTDPSHTLTLKAPSLGSSFTLKLPSSNGSGILSNDGSGNLSWLSLGLGNLPLGSANQFLVTNSLGLLVTWQGLNIGSGLTGNGIGTALDIASTYPGQSSITTLGTITTGTWNGSTIAVGNGGTGTTSFTSGELLVGNGTSAITSGPAWNSGTSTLTGNISGSAASATTATNATNVATTATNSNASYYPLFASSASSGNQAAQVNSGLSYNPSNGTLTATSFSGSFSGNATTATSATSFTGSLSGDVTGTQSATAINGSSAAGGHIISALTANAGTLTNNTSGNAATATTATNATNATNIGTTASSSNASYYPVFVGASSSGNQAAQVNSGLSYNPSTGTLAATSFSGSFSGNATTATSATNFTGSLSGDVTGTQSATTVVKINGNTVPANAAGALTNNGTGTLSWSPAFTNPMTSPGDLLYGGTSGNPTRLAATATANQVLLSGANAAPSWSTATYPTTTTANQLLYSNATNTITGLATSNSGVLVTSNSGVPSISATLPSVGIGVAPTSNMLAVGGNIELTNAANDKITTANSDLVLEQTGDVYGTTRLHIQNRNGSNCALFEQAGTVNLADFGFKPGATGVQSNIRLEDRNTQIRNTANDGVGEFQFYMNTTGANGGSPTYNFSTGEGATSIEVGNVGIGLVNPSQKLTVYNGNVLLSNNGTADQLQLQGSGSGSTSFQAGAQGSTNIIYTLPTALPSAANEALVATGTSSPVQLSWGTTMLNPMTSPGDLIYGGTSGTPTRLAATATANQVLLSGANAAPSWSTATYPATTTANQILYSSSNNNVTGLATANNGVLATNSSGVPSISATPTLGVPGTSTGSLSFANATGSQVTTIQAAASAPAMTYTLPASAPAANGQSLTSTTGGTMSWATVGTIRGGNFDADLKDDGPYYLPEGYNLFGGSSYTGTTGSSPSIADGDVLLENSGGTLQNLYVALDQNPGWGNSVTVTIYSNHGGSWASTGITVTISGSSTSGSDTSDTASISAGDEISMKVTMSGGSDNNSKRVIWAFGAP